MRRYKVLASDYDGTLAHEGRVPVFAEQALARFRQAGGLVLLVTGRRHEELEEVWPGAHESIDLLVAENGGLLVDYPADQRRTLLGARLPDDLHEVLHEEGVHVFETGELIVSADRDEFEDGVRRAAARLDGHWQCQVVPNRDRVMLMPKGIDKATGLRAALKVLGVDASAAVAIGDAENDLPFLQAAGLGVAVSDSVEALLAVADRVAGAPGPWGVEETVDLMLKG